MTGLGCPRENLLPRERPPLSRKPVAVFPHLLGTEMLPNVQSRPPLHNFKTFPCVLSLDAWDKSSAPLCAFPFLRKLQRARRWPQPPFIQTRQTRSSWLLSTGHSFYPFHQLCCLPLNSFRDLPIFTKHLLPFWAQMCTHSRWGHSSTVDSRIITSLSIWCLMSPGCGLASDCLKLGLLSASTSSSLSAGSHSLVHSLKGTVKNFLRG